MKNEIWKPILGYESHYEVSNLGNVRSVDRQVPDGRADTTRHRSSKILKREKTRKGYWRINLSKNGIIKRFQVHRLVAIAFIPNPNNYPFINHINGIRDDNRVENLEWCTNSYNQRYENCNGRKGIRVAQIGENFYKEYPALVEAARQTGIAYQCISACARGLKGYKTAGGYKWKFI